MHRAFKRFFPFAVSSKHVLTAAHCVQAKDRDPIDAKNVLAVFRRDFDARDSSRNISEFFLHPDWDVESNHYDGDIAIGLLKHEIDTFRDLYLPICLNENAIDTLHGKRGEVVKRRVGGAIDFSFVGENFQVEIVGNAKCENQTKRLTYGTAFCAGNSTVRVACKGEKSAKFSEPSTTHSNFSFSFAGDAGSAMFIAVNGVYRAVGIVSTQYSGKKVCNVGHYQLYTDVAHYRTWIEVVVFETY